MATKQGSTPFDSLGSHKRDLSAAEMMVLSQLAANDSTQGATSVWAMSRQFLQQLFDPRRNLDDECGYPPLTEAISAETYRQLYDREPIANRVVEVMPKECWQQQPLIYETEDSDKATEFEEAWDDLEVALSGPKSWHTQELGSTLYGYLLRADILSRIGHFGVLLMGFDDGKDLQQPIDGVIDMGDMNSIRSKPNGKSNGKSNGNGNGKPNAPTNSSRAARFTLNRLPPIPDSPIHPKEQAYLLNLRDSEATYHEVKASTPIKLIKSSATIALNSQEKAVVKQWVLERDNLIANQRKFEEAKKRKEQEDRWHRFVGNNNFLSSSNNPYAGIHCGPIAGAANSLAESYGQPVAQGYIAPYDAHPTQPQPNQRARDFNLPSTHGRSMDGRDINDVMGLRVNQAIGEWASEQAFLTNEGDNCGIGPGGFQHGNTCARGGGGGVPRNAAGELRGEGHYFVSGKGDSTIGHLPNSVGIDRKDMPQVKTKDQKEFVKWAQKQGFKFTKGSMRVDDAYPTQHEFDQKRIDANHNNPELWAEKSKKPVLVSEEGRVLDGTHHWLKHMQDGRRDMPIIKIHLPVKEALQLLHKFPKTVKSGVAVENIGFTQPNIFSGSTSWLDEPIINRDDRDNRYDEEDDDTEDWEWATDADEDEEEPTDNDAWGETSGNYPDPRAEELYGTDKQYAWQGALPPQALAGTDQQYFGVQFGPSEQMSETPARGKRRLLFLRPFDESLVQIVRYEWNIRNPRFGQPVMYRITLNDPREQHSGVGLPLATVFVHWSRVIHLADNLKSSEIFGVPAMRPVLNPILDIRKVRGASSEGYWKSCFSGDTKFFDGYVLRELKDCLGETVTVTCVDGKKRPATVERFGVRKFVRVELAPVTDESRGIRFQSKFRRFFTATADHRWVLQNGTVTTSLKPGDVLASNKFPEADELPYDAAGFAHGVIFGDGNMRTGRSHYFEVKLHGKKAHLFDALKETAHIARPAGWRKDGKPFLIFVNHEVNMKQLPDPDKHSEAYINSFLNGWIATDGHDCKKSNGSMGLSSSRPDAIEWFIANAPYYGYEISGYSVYTEATNKGERNYPLYMFRFRRERRGYVVKSIIDEGEIGESYCVVEPETKTFTLEGGVVTGNCFAGISLETNPTLGGDVAIDIGSLRDMAENFQNGLQRWMALSGMTAKSIAPSVVDPTPYLTNCIEHICIQLGIPIRVFKGSERGELASSQDDASWNDRVKSRQDNYVTPRIIKPFVDRLIAVGVLPEPKEGYIVEWPDLDSNTDKDKAAIALQITQAIAAFVSGQIESVMTFHDYLTRVLDYTEEAADAIVEAAQDLHGTEEGDTMTMPPAGEQGHPASPPPPPPKPIIMGGGAGGIGGKGMPPPGAKQPPNPQDAKIAALAKAQARQGQGAGTPRPPKQPPPGQ